jgi:hypothetical protein|tara:strand:- start:101 stop:703 length:603 start_codon:yes stop_codon:yes gene_type:complete
MKMRHRPIAEPSWWLTILIGTLVLLPAITLAGKTIRVQGLNANYKITEKRGAWRLKGPGMNGFAIRDEGGGTWSILDPAGAIRLKGKKSDQGELILEDVAGVLKYKLTFKDQSYTVFDSNGDLFVRVVITGDDGFEVYGHDGKKTMVGIAKKRSVAVKEVKSSTVLFKIKGCDTMMEASLFAIPIQFTGNVLIWQVLSTR